MDTPSQAKCSIVPMSGSRPGSEPKTVQQGSQNTGAGFLPAKFVGLARSWLWALSEKRGPDMGII